MAVDISEMIETVNLHKNLQFEVTAYKKNLYTFILLIRDESNGI